MAKVFITGSSRGLGLMAGQLLVSEGHTVVLHARNAARAEEARRALPGAAAVLVGDVSTLAAMRDLAARANALGRFDAVIHNVAIGYRERCRIETEDGLSQLWAVNVLAPYVLTASMHRPGRLVYLSSELHRRGYAGLDDPQWTQARWDGTRAYSDTGSAPACIRTRLARTRGIGCSTLAPGCRGCTSHRCIGGKGTT